eukprot:12428720-Karenia_brevis.AAC.1
MVRSAHTAQPSLKLKWPICTAMAQNCRAICTAHGSLRIFVSLQTISFWVVLVVFCSCSSS